MFEFIYYVSVIWRVKLDFGVELSYWVENEMGWNWRIPIHALSIFEIIRRSESLSMFKNDLRRYCFVIDSSDLKWLLLNFS